MKKKKKKEEFRIRIQGKSSQLCGLAEVAGREEMNPFFPILNKSLCSAVNCSSLLHMRCFLVCLARVHRGTDTLPTRERVAMVFFFSSIPYAIYAIFPGSNYVYIF